MTLSPPLQQQDLMSSLTDTLFFSYILLSHCLTISSYAICCTHVLSHWDKYTLFLKSALTAWPGRAKKNKPGTDCNKPGTDCNKPGTDLSQTVHSKWFITPNLELTWDRLGQGSSVRYLAGGVWKTWDGVWSCPILDRRGWVC